ncbi:MAG: hypothetical protein Q9227_000411 [Pyrenula ochraceoflavens]
MARLEDLPGELRNQIYGYVFSARVLRARRLCTDKVAELDSDRNTIPKSAAASATCVFQSIKFDGIHPSGYGLGPGVNCPGEVEPKSLLQVNRFIRREAAFYMYKGISPYERAFLFDNERDFEDYLTSVDPSFRPFIDSSFVGVNMLIHTDFQDHLSSLIAGRKLDLNMGLLWIDICIQELRDLNEVYHGARDMANEMLQERDSIIMFCINRHTLWRSCLGKRGYCRHRPRWIWAFHRHATGKTMHCQIQRHLGGGYMALNLHDILYKHMNRFCAAKYRATKRKVLKKVKLEVATFEKSQKIRCVGCGTADNVPESIHSLFAASCTQCGIHLSCIGSTCGVRDDVEHASGCIDRWKDGEWAKMESFAHELDDLQQQLQAEKAKSRSQGGLLPP